MDFPNNRDFQCKSCTGDRTDPQPGEPSLGCQQNRQPTVAVHRKKSKTAKMREKVMAEYQREQALARFQEEKPQMWLQSQRMGKLVEIQDQLDGGSFPEGSCFLHCSTVGNHAFALKRVTGIDLDTCQVTLEIFGDEDLEFGIVVIPLESIEWFGFPAKAVPIGIHFEGFTKGPHTLIKTDKEGKAETRPLDPKDLLRSE